MIHDIERIVNNNLGLMRSSTNGGMKYLLSIESVGGNAGVDRSCVNFLYSDMTGEIICFRNLQNIPSEWLDVLPRGYFLISRSFDPKISEKIVGANIAQLTTNLAKKVIYSSISAYNASIC